MKLEKQFNSQLVSLLNDCDEPIIIMFPPSYTAYKSKEEAMNNPVSSKIYKKSEISGRNFDYVYSSLSSQTII